MFAKNSRLIVLTLVVIATMLSSCAKKIITTTSDEDDLSLYRNKYLYEREVLDPKTESKYVYITLEYDSSAQHYHITKELDLLLDYRPVLVEGPWSIKTFEGYRIQIYRGRSREEASKARQRCYDLFSNRLTPYMKYSSPTYRIRVGDFLEEYECKQYYKILKKECPTALIVPDLVNITVKHIPNNYQRENGKAPITSNEEKENK